MTRSSPRLRFTGGTLVLPDQILSADLLVADGKIIDIDPSRAVASEIRIETSGLHVLPGVVDDQVHFREPGLTHKEDLRSATRACAKGGVTSFLEMPNTIPSTTTRARLEEKLRLAEASSLVNYGFYLGATTENLEELARGTRTPGIKIFIGSSTGELLVDDQDTLERIFAETTLPIAAHCEDESTIRGNRQRIGSPHDVADHSRIRDHAAAIIATRRALDLAYRHCHRFHVLHLSTAAEVELVRDHRGLITAEACPHHLLLSVEDYSRLGSRAQMNPSLKLPQDQAALWRGLRDGAIQVVATDHAPHTLGEKSLPYPDSPAGVPAVENSLALMLDQSHRGQCELRQIAHWMSDAPARVWGLVGKGRIKVGYDADLVLVDLEREHTILDQRQETKCKWSPWHGVTLRGLPVQTWVGGYCVHKDGLIDDSRRGSELRFDHSRGGYWGTM